MPAGPLIGNASRPLPGETACGDRCAHWIAPGRIAMAVADGLGHGPEAAHAAVTAVDCIAARLDRSCEECFAACDERLRGTRGAALALATVEGERLTVASVGNIRVLLLTASASHRLGGTCGIVGAGFDTLVPETRMLAPGDVLAMYSDGFDEMAPLRDLLYGSSLHPAQLAAIALERLASPADDASLLVYRHAPQ